MLHSRSVRPPVSSCDLRAPLEALEALRRRGFRRRGDDLQHVESHSLGKGSALPHDHLIPLTHAEARRDVSTQVRVALLVSHVLLDVVEVVEAHDDSPVHLRLVHDTSKDAAANGNVAGERALLVDVVALDRLLGSLEAQADVLVPALAILARRSLRELQPRSFIEPAFKDFR